MDSVLGQQIGWSTGSSTGIPLHVEIQYLNLGELELDIPYLDRPYVATYMGIPNVYMVCSGIMMDSSPPPTSTKRNFLGTLC